MRRRRALAFVAAGTVAVGAGISGLIATAARADAPPGAGFQSLYLVAEAGGERVVATGAVNTVGTGATEADIPFAQAQLTSSTRHALSSAAWPGSLAGDLGSFLLLSSSQAPKQSTVLNDPIRAEAPSTSGDTTVRNNTAPGVSMTATATADNIVADALVGATEQAEVGSYGTTHVTSTTRITGTSSAEAIAQTSTQNLALGPGGLVSVGSVTSNAVVTTDGGVSKATGATVVTGMKIAGFPVSVDQDGVHSTGKGPSAKAANAAINKALAQSMTQIFLTEPQKTTSAAGVSYEAANLFMSFDNGGFYIEVGGARAIGGATIATAFETGGAPQLPPVAPPPAVAAPTVPTISTGTGALAPAGSAPLPQTAQPPVTAAPQYSLATAHLFDTGLGAGWLVAALLGAAAIAFGLWRLPDRLLEQQPTPCPLGENT
jgi:hypothetical protein